MTNFDKYVELVSSINRDGIANLVKWLKSSDASVAPASVRNRLACEGGFVQHALNTYQRLTDNLHFEYADDLVYSEDTIKIVGLLQDISLINYFKKYTKNVKKPDGSWATEDSYMVRDESERFVYGSHSENSVYMLRKFIPLSYEEEIAVLHHMGGCDPTDAGIVRGTPSVYARSTLAMYAHIADMQATYIDDLGGVHDEPNSCEAVEDGKNRV